MSRLLFSGRLAVLSTRLAVGLVLAAAVATPTAAAGAGTGTPLQVVGWAACEPRVGGWEVTWAVLNLGADDATVTAFSSELSGVRVGDTVPARDWIAGRLVEPRVADESSLEVTVARPAGADEGVAEVVGGTIELGACIAPGLPDPRSDKGKAGRSVEVRSAAGCDGLAVVVAGPVTGNDVVVTVAVPGRDSLEVRARPSELSEVAVLPPEPDTTVEVTAGNEIVETLTWVRPEGCSRGVPPALLAGGGVLALVMLAVGGFLLARRSRRVHG